MRERLSVRGILSRRAVAMSLCCVTATPAVAGIVFDQISSAQPAFTTTWPGQEIAEDMTLDLSGGTLLTGATFAVLNAGFHSTGRLIASVYADDPVGLQPGALLGRASAPVDLATGSATAPVLAMITVPLPNIEVLGARVWTSWMFEIDTGPGNGLGVRQTSGPAAVGSSADRAAFRGLSPEGGLWSVRTEGGISDPRFTYNYRIELQAVPSTGGVSVAVLALCASLRRQRRQKRYVYARKA